MGCDTVCRQDATTLRPDGREEKQRRQRAVARLNRVRSVFTQQVKRVVAAFASIHAVCPAVYSGQLPFLGSLACSDHTVPVIEAGILAAMKPARRAG